MKRGLSWESDRGDGKLIITIEGTPPSPVELRKIYLALYKHFLRLDENWVTKEHYLKNESLKKDTLESLID